MVWTKFQYDPNPDIIWGCHDGMRDECDNCSEIDKKIMHCDEREDCPYLNVAEEKIKWFGQIGKFTRR